MKLEIDNGGEKLESNGNAKKIKNYQKIKFFNDNVMQRRIKSKDSGSFSYRNKH